MASNKSPKSAKSLTGMSGSAPSTGKSSSLFPKESQSPDHKTGKQGRITLKNAVLSAHTPAEARKGGSSPARETQKRASVSASGKKGK